MLVSSTSCLLRSSSELSTRPRSKALTRWFIVVDRAKKRKSLARPGTYASTRTNPNLVRKDKNLAEDIIDFLARLPMEADMEDCLRVPKKVHCLFFPAYRKMVFRILGDLVCGKPLSNHSSQNDFFFIDLEDYCFKVTSFCIRNRSFHQSLQLLCSKEMRFHLDCKGM